MSFDIPQDPPFESDLPRPWWASGLESFIRQLLDSDPHTRESLAEIEGKIVDIVIQSPEGEKSGGLRLLFEAQDMRLCRYPSKDGSNEGNRSRSEEEGIDAASKASKASKGESGRGERAHRGPETSERTGSDPPSRRGAPAPESAHLTITGTPFSLLRFAASGERQEMVLSADVVLHGDTALAARLQTILSHLDIDFEELAARRIGDIPARTLMRGVREISGRLREAGDALYADLSEYLRYESELVASQDEGERFGRGVEDLRDDVGRLEARIALLEEPAGKGE
ncbi:MAG: hypothetical protein ISN28_05365 [Ectothiorhodospiraceae bacterium AqS1]|nr:hypothetical protein [Ectothiorhodospiraceae bacterium AqS1]